MKEKTLKKIWAEGGAAINGWLCIPSSMSAEIMACQGFDSIVVDLQHGAIDYQVAITLFQAISTTPVIPLARVPWNEPGILMKILDAGACGIICPMINNAKEAEALVQACKYPPRGYRSVGPIRAKYAWHVPSGTDYIDHADANTVVIPQIETAEALENLDRILEVSGIDAVYVGPGDLAMGLGSHARTGQNDAVVVAAKQKVADACKRHGKIAGMHTPSADAALKAIEAGFRFVSIASDDRFLAAKASAEMKSVRTALSQRRAVS